MTEPALVAALNALTAELKRYNDAREIPKPGRRAEAEVFRAHYGQDPEKRELHEHLQGLEAENTARAERRPRIKANPGSA
jgi:hypothetical protein